MAMSEILQAIERVKSEMDRLVVLAIKQHDPLSDSEHYNRILELNEILEGFYRELAYNEPVVYRNLMVANAVRSETIYKTYALNKDGCEEKTKGQ